jgi:hypothetical protein
VGIQQHDLALLTARWGAARFGASRFGFIPCPEDVLGLGADEPGAYVWTEQTPESQIVDTVWTLQNEDCSCRQLCTLELANITGSYWKLDEASGTRADSLGTWTLGENGGVVAAAAGRINNSAVFVATDNKVLRSAVPITLSESFTCVFWYYATASSQSFAALVSVGSTWPNGVQFTIYRVGVNNLIARVSDGVVGQEAIYAAGWGTGHWVQVAAAYDAATRKVTLYVSPETDFLETASTSAALASTRSEGPDYLWVGSSGGLYANDNYDGKIDELTIVPYIMSTDERRAHFELTRPGFVDGAVPEEEVTLTVMLSGVLGHVSGFAHVNWGDGGHTRVTHETIEDGPLQFNHTYNEVGTYTISVDVTDERGCRVEITLSATVVASSEVYATWGQDPESSLVTFTAHYGSLDVISIDWDYGEGVGYELDLGTPVVNQYGGIGQDATYPCKVRVNAVEGIFEDTFNMTTNWAAGQSGSSQ